MLCLVLWKGHCTLSGQIITVIRKFFVLEPICVNNFCPKNFRPKTFWPKILCKNFYSVQNFYSLSITYYVCQKRFVCLIFVVFGDSKSFFTAKISQITTPKFFSTREISPSTIYACVCLCKLCIALSTWSIVVSNKWDSPCVWERSNNTFCWTYVSNRTRVHFIKAILKYFEAAPKVILDWIDQVSELWVEVVATATLSGQHSKEGSNSQRSGFGRK